MTTAEWTIAPLEQPIADPARISATRAASFLDMFFPLYQTGSLSWLPPSLYIGRIPCGPL